MILNALSLVAAVSSLVIGFAISPANAAPRYIAVPIATAAGLASTGTAINASGDVVGNVAPDYAWYGEETRAFRSVVDKTQELGTLGGLTSGATGISDDGQIAGWSWAADGHMRAFLDSNNSMRALLGDHEDTGSSAYGMSPDGQVTGWFSPSTGGTHAFRYTNGSVQDLGTLGGTRSMGFGINQAGEVTGSVWLADGSLRAFIYSGGVMRALGTFGGSTSGGFAINAVGQATGVANTNLESGHAFLYTDDKMLDLGTLGGPESFGLAINVRGDVVGYSHVDKNSREAFLYTESSMYNLNSLVVSGLDGFKLFEARGINDRGQIAATGWSSAAERTLAFRLDPVAPDSPNTAIEYHHAAFDHYFLTANPAEIAAMDSGHFSGWSRTGQTFNVHLDAPVGTNAVCRFFSAAFTSHFYTANADECALVKTYQAWQFEGIAFNIAVPDPNGDCPSTTQPVYRLYNNGKGAAPNHRYTTSLTTRSQMVDAGWVPEGSGPLGVAMCAPQ